MAMILHKRKLGYTAWQHGTKLFGQLGLGLGLGVASVNMLDITTPCAGKDHWYASLH